jgi:hypothetical protein
MKSKSQDSNSTTMKNALPWDPSRGREALGTLRILININKKLKFHTQLLSTLRSFETPLGSERPQG